MTSLQEQIVQLRQNLDDAESHIKSLESGRKSSSSKGRASLMKIKQQSHNLRKEIMAFQKSLPTKSRVKKAEPAEPEPVKPEVKEPEEELPPEPPKLKRSRTKKIAKE